MKHFPILNCCDLDSLGLSEEGLNYVKEIMIGEDSSNYRFSPTAFEAEIEEVLPFVIKNPDIHEVEEVGRAQKLVAEFTEMFEELNFRKIDYILFD